MNKLPLVDRKLEKLLQLSLKTESLPISSDNGFIEVLQQRLALAPQAPSRQAKERGNSRRPERGSSGWQSGVFNGVAGVAVGLILLLGLNTLPGFLVRISIAGSSLAHEKLITLSIRQQVAWNQLMVSLENETRIYLQR
ncbi:MAG: hypothetical protein K6U80_15545 [Firmicutes bacterium]|nr:hypothetical protein [Bacillota bacterium]